MSGTVATDAVGGECPEQPGLVSVVIIFLNEERYLREAIESVLSQDYPHWELLLVDDGSTDRSPGIARGFAAADERIRYLVHSGRANKGMSASRNLGLLHARGEYVAFLDADDIYLPTRLRRHVDVLRTQPNVAMSASSYLRCLTNESGAIDTQSIVSYRPFFVVGDAVWEPPLGLLVVTHVPYLNLGTFSVTVRRRIALEAGGFEDAFHSMYEDLVFATKILARHTVYLIQDYLACYRHHSSSVTKKWQGWGALTTESGRTDAERFLEWQLDYLRQHGVDDPLIVDTIRERRFRAARLAGRMATVRKLILAALRSMLDRVLPRRWYRQLLAIDFQLDSLRARWAYWQLTRILSERKRSRALDGKST